MTVAHIADALVSAYGPDAIGRVRDRRDRWAAAVRTDHSDRATAHYVFWWVVAQMVARRGRVA